ncbi:MAG: hypothetical protein Q8M83_00780 [bacterium]|nr:hypothetical protein [bacterium]
MSDSKKTKKIKDLILKDLFEDFKKNDAPGSFRDELTRAILAKTMVVNLAQDGKEQTGLAGKVIIQSNNKDVQVALNKAEDKIGRALNTSVDSDSDDDDDDDEKSSKSMFPNLKYRQPKYQNVESVLKYVESEKEKGDGRGDVRIVIMNFND